MALAQLIRAVRATFSSLKGGSGTPKAPELPLRLRPVLVAMERFHALEAGELLHQDWLHPQGANRAMILEAHEWLRVSKLGPQAHAFLREVEARHLCTRVHSEDLVGWLRPGASVALLAKPLRDGGPLRTVAGGFEPPIQGLSAAFRIAGQRFNEHEIISLAVSDVSRR